MGLGTPTICRRGSEIIAWASAAPFASSFSRKPLEKLLHTDYNVESQYYGVHSSNHAEQAESQFELIRSFLPTAATGAANLQRFFNKSCEADTGPGLTFPSHIAPWGYTASIGPTPMGDQRIRWNGELAMTVLLWCVRGHLEALCLCGLMTVLPSGIGNIRATAQPWRR